MPIRLNDENVAKLQPKQNNTIEYDITVRGFGVRISPAGVKSFILTYRIDGHQRRLTIGSCKDWTSTEARREAQDLVAKINKGIDPLDERKHRVDERRQERVAPTVEDLWTRYVEEHLPTKRPRSQVEDRTMATKYILPELGELKVTQVAHSDISMLHRKITKAGHATRANAVKRLLTTMFNLAIRWKLRADNPCEGVVMNVETPRERYLTPGEVARLMKALTELEDREGANLIMLALLTGARRNELMQATWSQIDLRTGYWTKPSSHTKQKRTHRVPLTAAALELLTAIRNDASKGETMVFPTRAKLGNVRAPWERVREAAGMPEVRFHDLRHSFASLLISDGQSLQVVGRLLGHTQASTTMRYSHISDEALLKATARVGKLVTGR